MPFSADGDVTAEDVRQRDAVLQAWRAGFARVEVPGNRVVEEVLRNNVRDIASFPMLDGPRDEWLALQAGVPLYPAFFGRDGVTAGWQAGYVDQGEALAAALTKLGRLQSDRVDDWRDEEPGRIPYQIRRGPLARLDLNPYSGYYADFASPLMFVISLANLWAWTGDRQHVQRHWDTARRILEWARTLGDRDGDGYLEYQTQIAQGHQEPGLEGQRRRDRLRRRLAGAVADRHLRAAGLLVSRPAAHGPAVLGHGRARRRPRPRRERGGARRRASTATGGWRTSSSTRWRSIPRSGRCAR